MCDLQMVDFATQAHTYINTWAEITPLEALLPRFLGLTEMLPNGWARKRFDGVYVIYLKAKAKAKAIRNQNRTVPIGNMFYASVAMATKTHFIYKLWTTTAKYF